MKNKKGYTLVELIVAIAIASILFVAIGAGTIFLIRLQNSSLENSATTLKIISLKDYIIKNGDSLIDEQEDYQFIYDSSDKTLSYKGEVLLSDVEEIGIQFNEMNANEDEDETNDFYTCTITYHESDVIKTLTFIVKSIN